MYQASAGWLMAVSRKDQDRRSSCRSLSCPAYAGRRPCAKLRRRRRDGPGGPTPRTTGAADRTGLVPARAGAVRGVGAGERRGLPPPREDRRGKPGGSPGGTRRSTSMSSSPSAVGAAGQRWFLLALVLFFVGLSGYHSFKVARHKSAILRWQRQLLDLSDNGTDISAAYNYPNPPVMAVILSPLARLPPRALAFVWFYVEVGVTFLVLLWV